MNDNPNDLFREHQRTRAVPPKRQPIERWVLVDPEWNCMKTFGSRNQAEQFRFRDEHVVRLTEAEPLERRIAELEARLAKWGSARRVHVSGRDLDRACGGDLVYVYDGAASEVDACYGYITLCVVPEGE